MKLADLLPVGATVSDARFATLEVSGVSADSRTIRPGDLFVALAGAKDDGMRFVGPALRSGAVAVMAERAPPDQPKVSPSSRSPMHAAPWRWWRRNCSRASRA